MPRPRLDPRTSHLTCSVQVTRSDYSDRRIISARADTITVAQADVDRFFGVDAELHAEACVRFRAALMALYSDVWHEIVLELQAGDADAVEPAIVFLEADPWCVRSGYAKERILPSLCRTELSATQQARLRNWLVVALSKGPRREYWLMIRLAMRLASPDLSTQLRALAARSTPSARSSIERVVDAVDAAQAQPVKRLSDEAAPGTTTVEH